MTGAPWPPHPGLDAATRSQLENLGFDYTGTRWNSYFGDWEHHLTLTMRGYARQLRKTDVGIARLLAPVEVRL